MAAKRFLMNAGRTTKQGQQINVGKDSAEYQALVNTLIMNPDDMKEAGITQGGSVRIRKESGRGHLLQGRQCARGDHLRPLRSADVPTDGHRHRWHRHADQQGLGGRGGADRGTCNATGKGNNMNTNPTHDDTKYPDEASTLPIPEVETPKAWEMIEIGRYKPRRIRGSFLGGDLG